MLSSFSFDLILLGSMVVTATLSGLAAYRTYRGSVLDDLIGDRQLVTLLRKRELLEDFAKGSLRCDVCGEPLYRENLRLVVSDGTDLRFSCGRLRCTSDFIARRARMLEASVAG